MPGTRVLGLRVLGLLLVLAAVCGCGPRAQEARLLLDDVAAGPRPTQLKASTPAPQRSAVAWRVEGRPGAGDLYLSGPGPHARLVLVPGLSELGKDDPRLVALAHSLARVRFAVLVPDLADLRRLRVAPSDARDIADAARHLAERPIDSAPPGPVGVAAVSYAVGPAVLAAARPEAAPATAFVLAIGGYFDMTAAITYVTTGHYRESPSAPWQRGTPNPAGKWLFAESNAERIADPADRDLIVAMARRRRADPAAPVADLAARLGPEGRAVYDLMENADPDAVPALIARLPAGLRADLAALSPAGQDLSALRARLVLVHGHNDPVIPATESRRLAAAMQPSQAVLFLVDRLDHVDLEERPGLLDRLILWHAAQHLLAERDRLTAAGSAG